jgi:hypothetical protein
MWIVAIMLWILLDSQTAAAFESTGVTLPSSLVICSDPELVRLADERQEAINEALRHRLWGAAGSPAALPGLSSDQGVLQPGRCRAYCLSPGIWRYRRERSDIAVTTGSQPGSHRAEL